MPLAAWHLRLCSNDLCSREANSLRWDTALNTLRGKSRQLESRITTLEYAAGSAERDAEKLDSMEKDFALVKQRLEDCNIRWEASAM